MNDFKQTFWSMMDLNVISSVFDVIITDGNIGMIKVVRVGGQS